jgi:hypothetical protein
VDLPELRPLSLGELLDRTFSYYRRRFWLFVGIMAIPEILIVSVNVTTQGLLRILRPAAGTATPPEQAMGGFAGFFLGMMLLGLAYFVFYALALGATTFAISEVHLGRATSTRAAYRMMRGRFWRLLDLIITVIVRIFLAFVLIMFVTMLPMGVLAGLAGPIGAAIGGLLALVVMLGGTAAVVWLFLRYGCAVPALLLENLKAKKAIQRSIALTKNNLARVLLIVLLMTLVTWIAAFLFQGPFFVTTIVLAAKTHVPAPFWLSVLTVIAGGIGHAVTAPLLMIALVLLYYDIRVRKEAFDLQLIMSALDARAPVAGAAPAAPLEATPQLDRTSVALLVLLTLITFGLYYPFWFMRRKSEINALQSREKLSLVPFLAVCLIWLLDFFLNLFFAQSTRMGLESSPSWLVGFDGLASLAGGVILVLQAFKVRRIMEDHLEASRTGPLSTSIALLQGLSLSAVATFFFGIFYLQYKINDLVDVWTEAQPGVGPDAIPVV